MRFVRPFLCALLALAFLPAQARTSPDALPEIAAKSLPAEARDVLARIRAGGPFAFDRDGVVFGNREGSLPHQKRGYYHEYTVPTPGVHHRGARRIVCGAAPADCYYTADHYRTFARIRE